MPSQPSPLLRLRRIIKLRREAGLPSQPSPLLRLRRIIVLVLMFFSYNDDTGFDNSLNLVL